MTSEPPVSGSSRDVRNVTVWRYLVRNSTGSHTRFFTYADLATNLGMEVDAVKQAVYDLRTHYAENALLISVPTYGRGYLIEVGLRAGLLYGLANQLKHLATRENSEAVLFERIATVEQDSASAFIYRDEAAQSRASSLRHRELAQMMQTKARAMNGSS